jgi:hypothetical protein
VFRRTNASAFTYADLSLLSALIVDTAVVAAGMPMINYNYDPSTPQSQTRMAVDTAAGVVDEDPQEAMKAQTVVFHCYPPSPLQTQTNGMDISQAAQPRRKRSMTILHPPRC